MRHRRGFGLATGAMLVGAVGLFIGFGACLPSYAEPIQTGPREPNLMPGQVIDGWTGLPIPCRCRFQGETYRLGDLVCMSTYQGVVMTRCELFLNNTSWQPTKQPCTISEAKQSRLAGIPVPFLRQPQPFCRAG
jgi:hypothetical protein